MCKHQYSKHHPDEDCIICFHSIFQNMTYSEIIMLMQEKGIKRQSTQTQESQS